MSEVNWKVGSASVRGKGHEQTGLPCQDASTVKTSADGKWAALVVSDGAGSAPRSEVGANAVVSAFGDSLISIAAQLESRQPGAWVTDKIIQEILRIREGLREVAKSDDISDFHCTLVAALIGPTGGFSIHLGDGSIFGGYAPAQVSDAIDLSSQPYVSEPQNGEYANETVFVTERDWVKHLRVQPIGRMDWIVLGSDGGMALAMVNERYPKGGFVAPVLTSFVQQPSQEARNKLIQSALNDPQADRLTNDDKSLVIATRGHYSRVSGVIPAAPPHKKSDQAESVNELAARVGLKQAPTRPITTSLSKQGPMQPGAVARSRLLPKKSLALWIKIAISIFAVLTFAALLYAWMFSEYWPWSRPPTPEVLRALQSNIPPAGHSLASSPKARNAESSASASVVSPVSPPSSPSAPAR